MYDAGLIDVLAEAILSSSRSTVSAAIHVLLQLLLYYQRVQPLEDAPFLAPLHGPKMLAEIGKSALANGMLSAPPYQGLPLSCCCMQGATKRSKTSASVMFILILACSAYFYVTGAALQYVLWKSRLERPTARRLTA